MSKASSTRRLRIPVRFVAGVWECSLGGAVPVEEHAEAELIVERRSISDKAFLQTLERKAHHKVLDEGTPLLVCLTIKKPVPNNLKYFLQSYDNLRDNIATEFIDVWNPDTLFFVEVKLAGPEGRHTRLFESDRGGLWLLSEGIEATGLASTTVKLPEPVSADPVFSLNHAYTKLSEAYETWRISHTGNIYTRVLYQEKNEKWYPLDLLRNKTLDRQGKEIANKIWEEFMQKMTVQPKNL